MLTWPWNHITYRPGFSTLTLSTFGIRSFLGGGWGGSSWSLEAVRRIPVLYGLGSTLELWQPKPALDMAKRPLVGEREKLTTPPPPTPRTLLWTQSINILYSTWVPEIDLKICMPGLEWASQVAEAHKCPSHQFFHSLSIYSSTDQGAEASLLVGI